MEKSGGAQRFAQVDAMIDRWLRRRHSHVVTIAFGDQIQMAHRARVERHDEQITPEIRVARESDRFTPTLAGIR
jgi:hypothetical protein